MSVCATNAPSRESREQWTSVVQYPFRERGLPRVDVPRYSDGPLNSEPPQVVTREVVGRVFFRRDFF